MELTIEQLHFSHERPEGFEKIEKTITDYYDGTVFYTIILEYKDCFYEGHYELNPGAIECDDFYWEERITLRKVKPVEKTITAWEPIEGDENASK